jgi:hypothetical protein
MDCPVTIIIIFITGTTALGEPWPSSGFLNNLIFMVWACQPHSQPPTWRTRVSLFVWLLPLNLSGLDGLTSSYATISIALRVSGALKPHHHNKVGIASVGPVTTALPNWPSRVGFSFPSHGERNKSRFWNNVFSLYVLLFWTGDKVLKQSNSECYTSTPSSQPFRLYSFNLEICPVFSDMNGS